MKPDFGRAADDYAEHRAGFPDSFFHRIADLGVVSRGSSVVDLGTGTGTLARGFAARGCRVIGIDPSSDMIEQAQRLAVNAGLDVEFRVATAEDTGLEPSSADVVCAGQCWHWFDRARAAAEAGRILAPEGWLLIAHFDWIPLPGNVCDATEKLIEIHNPDWNLSGGSGMHPWWMLGLGEAGFRDIESFSYDVDTPYSHAGWRGRIRASAGIGASLPAERIEAFDRALAALLAERFPEATLRVPHRVFAILARAPAAQTAP